MRVSTPMPAKILAVIALLSASAAMAAAPGRPPSTPVEAGVLAEINVARADPAAYARGLRRFRAYYHGKLVMDPGHGVAMMTDEGVAAVDDAIAYLARQKPLPPLALSPALTRSASRFAADIGPVGLTGHVGTDRSTMSERMRAVGVWAGSSAEVVAFGHDRAPDIVLQLIIDDGVPSRGHRTAIFDPGLTVAGVGCGPHKVYRFMCVVDFAGALMAR